MGIFPSALFTIKGTYPQFCPIGCQSIFEKHSNFDMSQYHPKDDFLVRFLLGLILPDDDLCFLLPTTSSHLSSIWINEQWVGSSEDHELVPVREKDQLWAVSGYSSPNDIHSSFAQLNELKSLHRRAWLWLGAPRVAGEKHLRPLWSWYSGCCGLNASANTDNQEQTQDGGDKLWASGPRRGASGIFFEGPSIDQLKVSSCTYSESEEPPLPLPADLPGAIKMKKRLF